MGDSWFTIDITVIYMAVLTDLFVFGQTSFLKGRFINVLLF